jgi:hypothetical protein
MEIDATSGQPLSIFMLNYGLEKPDPVVGVSPPAEWRLNGLNHDISDESEKARIAGHLRALIADVVKRMKLPCPEIGLDTYIDITGRASKSGDCGGRAKLTNKFAFEFTGGSEGYKITGFSASDCFFYTDRVIDLDDFVGKRKISERQAMKTAMEWIKLFDPKVKLTKRTDTDWPILPSSVTVPRCAFHWETSYGGTACVEVDLESNTVKSLQIN